MGKKVLVDLSHPFGATSPLWPYFQAPQIEKLHYIAKSGVLTQRITSTMHCSTHADSPAHVVEGAPYTHEIPLDRYYGDAVCVHIEKPKWGVITAEDLEAATPEIREGDIVIIHTGWHRHYGDSTMYYHYAPGLGRSAGEWFVKKGVKAVGVDQQALDHPLHTAIGPHGPGPLVPKLMDEYRELTGREMIEDFPEWEPCHNLILGNGIMGYENVGGDIEKVVGKRFKIMGFPIRWYMGDGSWVRLVAEIDEDDMNDVPDRVYKYGTF